jgi:sugar transferase (PEP-CTERM system associated)
VIRVFNQFVSPKSLLLVSLETILIALALVAGIKLRYFNSPSEFSQYTQLPDFALQSAIFVLMFQVCFYYCDFYNPVLIRNRSQQMMSLLQSMGAACLLLGLMYYIFPELLIGRGVLLISVVLVALLVMISRLALDRAWQLAGPRESILILGSGQLGTRVALEMKRRNDLPFDLVGFVDTGGDECRTSEILGLPVFGTLEGGLEPVVSQQGISRIIVAIEDRRGRLPTAELVKLRVQGVRIEDSHSTMASLTGRVSLETIRPSWFVFSDGFHRSKLTLIFKRSLDLSFGIVGFLLSLPIMLILGTAIRLDSKGPVIYRQSRVGFRGRTFDVLKFRSMRVDAESAAGIQWARKEDPRVTRMGRIMRQYRLDELPQFVNVIRGEMSFVGPRPERPYFVDQLRKVISYYDERHSVRPGLTGWAQVQYHYGSSVEDAVRKLEYDLFYLKNMSVLFDVAIVLKTVRIVLTGFGGR